VIALPEVQESRLATGASQRMLSGARSKFVSPKRHHKAFAHEVLEARLR